MFGKKNQAVFAIYSSKTILETAVDRLKSSGYGNSDISVLMPKPSESNDLAFEQSSKAPEGASAGAATGLVLGGSLGWLLGVGALAIPGFGPFIAAGPIMAALAGAGLVGALGGVTGALVGLGISEYQAKVYEGQITNGGILLSVHSESAELIKKAKTILEETGGKHISTLHENKEESVQKSDQPKIDRDFPQSF